MQEKRGDTTVMCSWPFTIDSNLDSCGACVWLTTGQLSFIKPLSQNGLQFAGILKAQLQIFKAAYGGLAELWAVHGSKSLAYIGLCVPCRSKTKGKHLIE